MKLATNNELLQMYIKDLENASCNSSGACTADVEATQSGAGTSMEDLNLCRPNVSEPMNC
jgi:hypothetical protein